MDIASQGMPWQKTSVARGVQRRAATYQIIDCHETSVPE